MSRQEGARKKASRDLAIAAVAVLVAIAIAGIVVAERGRALADSSPPLPAPLPLAPNAVRFAAESDQLPADANEKLARVAQAATAKKDVLITTQVEARTGQDPQMELARRRARAIHLALEAKGVSAMTIRTQITVSAGVVAPSRVDVFQIDLP